MHVAHNRLFGRNVYDTIKVSRRDRTAIVSLNRPDVRNAFNAQMISELTGAFAELAKDDDIRVVILRGDGPSFSAGADVNWMRSSLEFSEEENLRDALAMSDMFASINALPRPVLGRVHGAALGGGMGLMAVCDIVVAAEGTVFGFTEAKLGIVPAVISRFVLPKIGSSWARSLYLTGERFGTDVAQRIGLVHWVAAAASLDAVVEKKETELLSSGPSAAREAKRLIMAAANQESEELRSYTAEVIARVRREPEGQEGLRAFLDKREPGWRRPTATP